MSYPLGINDTDNFCKGVGAVCINDIPIGMLKSDSRVTLAEVADADVDVRCAQADGDLLGKRHGGTIFEISFEGVEVTLGNLKTALDLSGVVAGGVLTGGRRNKKATVFSLTCFAEAPGQKVRVWQFYQCVMDRLPSELLLGAAAEECSIPFKVRVLRVLNTPGADCYFRVMDY
jgi:hypothetical protein